MSPLPSPLLPAPAPAAAPGRPRWLPPALALLAAVLLHLWTLGNWRQPPRPRAVAPASVQARWMAAPDITPHTTPHITPHITPLARPKAQAQPPRKAAPASSGNAQAQAQPPTQPPGPSTEPGPAPAPAPDFIPVPALLALPLDGQGQADYAFTQGSEPGQARLSWQVQGDRYALTLERWLGHRALPTWHSEGRLGPQGLMPQRHVAQRGGRERQSLEFDRVQGRIRSGTGLQQAALPPGVQDRLSWWIQLAALMAAEPSPQPGLRLRIPVASMRAQVQDWEFEVVQRQGPLWQLRRVAHASAGDLQWELWLDASRGFMPARLRFSFDDEPRWEMGMPAMNEPAPSSPSPQATGRRP